MGISIQVEFVGRCRATKLWKINKVIKLYEVVRGTEKESEERGRRGEERVYLPWLRCICFCCSDLMWLPAGFQLGILNLVNANLVSFPVFFYTFFLRMFVWQRKLQSFLVFNLGNAAKFSGAQGAWQTIRKSELEPSAKGTSFRVGLIRCIFGIGLIPRAISCQTLCGSSFVIKGWPGRLNNSISMRFGRIISGYFGPLGRPRLTFSQNRKSFISILNKFRCHIKAKEARTKGPEMGKARERTLQRWVISID